MRHFKCKLYRQGGVEKRRHGFGPCKFGPGGLGPKCGDMVKELCDRDMGPGKCGGHHKHHGHHGPEGLHDGHINRHYGHHGHHHGHHGKHGHRGKHGHHGMLGHHRPHGHHGPHGHGHHRRPPCHHGEHRGPHHHDGPHERHDGPGPHHGPERGHRRGQDKLCNRFKKWSKEELVMALITVLEDAPKVTELTEKSETELEKDGQESSNENAVNEKSAEAQASDQDCQECSNEKNTEKEQSAEMEQDETVNYGQIQK